MRILHVTDTHLGAELQTWGHPRGWRRADDALAALRAALEPALREEADVVVHSGDVFDRSAPPADAIAEGGALLKEVARRVPVLIVRGNHDRHGVGRHFPEGIPGVRFVDVPDRVVLKGVSFACIPHQREAGAWTEAAARIGPGCDLVVAHQSFEGSRVPGFVFREGYPPETVGAAGLPESVRHVLCGHIHPRQTVRIGGATVVHPGSTVRTSFREGPEPKGYALWELGRDVKWRFVDLEDRPHVEVSGESDVHRVGPGALVRLARHASAEVARAVADRGAWFAYVKPPIRLPRPPAQASLFGPG
jgi:exonuclease SbcD